MGPATASACGRGQQQRNISATVMPKTRPLCTVTWSITGEIYGARKSRAKSSPRSTSPNVQLGSGAAGRGFEPMHAWCFHTSCFVTQVGNSRGLSSAPQPRAPALVLLPGSEDVPRQGCTGAAVRSESCARQLSALMLALHLVVQASLLRLLKDSQLSFCFFDPFSFPKLIPGHFIFVDAQSLKRSGKALLFLQDLGASRLAAAVIRLLPTVPALTERAPAGLGWRK